MSDPCKRCGDPEGQHESAYEAGTADERNCALYRIGTQLEHLNDRLEGLARALMNIMGR
jgi:hypothetical protein